MINVIHSTAKINKSIDGLLILEEVSIVSEFNYYGFHFFIDYRDSHGGFIVSEYKTGFRLPIPAQDNKELAKKESISCLRKYGKEKTIKVINKVLNDVGVINI